MVPMGDSADKREVDAAILQHEEKTNDRGLTNSFEVLTTHPKPDPNHPLTSFNPLRALLFLRYPFVMLTAISTGVSFGAMFEIETIMPDLFRDNYGLNSWQIGLCYLGGGTGNLLGSFLGGKYLDRVLAQHVKARGYTIPEDRFPASVFVSGFIVLPLGCLLFSWGVSAKLHLGVPIVGFALVCFAMTQVLLCGSTYLVDATGKGASATAAGNSVRNLFACVLSLIAAPLLETIGVGYLGVISAVLSVAGTIALLMNKIKGPTWRKAAGMQTRTS